MPGARLTLPLLAGLSLLLACGCATTDGGASRPSITAAWPERARITLLAGSGARPAALALQRRPHLELRIEDPLPLLERAARGAPDWRAAALPAGRQALARAREDYRTFRFSEAITRLSQAENQLAAEATIAADFALLARLALQRGLSQLALGVSDQAAAAFATALLLGHELSHAGEHPPEVEAAIKRVAEQLSSATRGGLTIKTQPAGARVWIDGKEQGAAPVTVQVQPGPHHVRVERPGQQARAFFQRVNPGRLERLEIYLKPAPVPEVARQLLAAQSAGQSIDLQEAGTLRRALGLEAGRGAANPGTGRRPAVLLTVRALPDAVLQARLVGQGDPHALPRPGARECRGKTPEQLARCLAPRLHELATGQPYAPDRPGPTRGRPAAAPIYRRWWFWTLVAAGVAAGTGTGIYFATRPDGTTDVDIVVAP